MTEGRRYQGPPWAGGRPGWRGPGRRFRRGALIFLSAVVLLVSVLATVVASVLAGSAPAPWITVLLSVFVLSGLALSVRWLWRNARAVGSLMDAADRVADGDYATRVPETGTRQLGRLTGAFNQMAAQLETNEQRRRELLADIAHELRTPLQVIRGTLEGILDGLYPADPDRLQPLLDETIVMARLLDDLRTLSMAEAGVLTLHREAIDPRALADDAVHAFRSMAEGAGVALSTTRDAAAPSSIEADPVRLGEVLGNLITNALRNTPAGGSVTVRVGSEAGMCAFIVEDTGRGIPADQLTRVFDRFVTSADIEGTGLGLAIAKRLVQAHGGTVEASGNGHGGTTIRFRIP